MTTTSAIEGEISLDYYPAKCEIVIASDNTEQLVLFQIVGPDGKILFRVGRLRQDLRFEGDSLFVSVDRHAELNISNGVPDDVQPITIQNHAFPTVRKPSNSDWLTRYISFDFANGLAQVCPALEEGTSRILIGTELVLAWMREFLSPILFHRIWSMIPSS